MPKEDNDDEYDDDDVDDYDNPFDFSDIFSDPSKLFNSKQFRRLFKDIFEKIWKNLPPEFQNLSPEDIQKEIMKNKGKFGFPFMYGFNVNIGPDGKPKVDSFGNIKSKPSGKPKVGPVREPLVEINEENEKITVIAEMPGVSKDDVELKATSHSITISTKSDSFGIKYYKEVELPSAIDSDYAKARLQNGILEVKLKKVDDKHKSIKID